jgi:hypothetical protein
MELAPERLLEAMLTAIPEDPAAFRELCDRPPDWAHLLEHGGRHGVRGVLCHQLTTLDCPLPLEVRRLAARQQVVDRLRQSQHRHALEQALRALHAAGVRAVVLKGPVLAERIYPDPSLRPSTDLDLLVLPSDLDRARIALWEIGYQSEPEGWNGNGRPRHHHVHLYRHHPPSPLIELHFRAHSPLCLDAQPLLSQAMPYRTAWGADCWILSPEDELLYLSAHAAGHYFLRLSWLYDLKLLLRAAPNLRGSLAAERARELGVAAMLSLTSRVLHHRLGVKIPGLDRFPASQGLRWQAFTALLSRTTTLPTTRGLGPRGDLAFHALLSDRPARFLMRRLVDAARHTPG